MANLLKTLSSAGHAALPKEAVDRCLGADAAFSFARGELDDRTLDAVDQHLDQCEACQQMVAEALLASSAPDRSGSGAVPCNASFRPGDPVAGRYSITNFIARGGMGEVYLAYDSVLGESVALKTVNAVACDGDQAVKHLKAEVQLARRVSHPNVCRIFDVGTHVLPGTNTVIHFLTMEFVEGETLGQRLRMAGPLPLDEAITTARQILAGLSAAHRAGILHRDLKSDNIMLRTTEAGPVAVILDFGLARPVDAATLSSSGSLALVGTLPYMAPEQVEGKKLVPASDLYAFGVLWFEMLTGELPFSAESPTSSALERLHRCAPPPSSVNPLVPKALDTVVQRCLGRFVHERFSDAEQVLEALDEAVRMGTVHPRRHLARWVVALCAGGALAALLMGALSGRLENGAPVPTGFVPPLRASPTVASAPVVAPTPPPDRIASVAPQTPDAVAPSKPPQRHGARPRPAPGSVHPVAPGPKTRGTVLEPDEPPAEPAPEPPQPVPRSLPTDSGDDFDWIDPFAPSDRGRAVPNVRNSR
jgi:hypothetical protein